MNRSKKKEDDGLLFGIAILPAGFAIGGRVNTYLDRTI